MICFIPFKANQCDIMIAMVALAPREKRLRRFRGLRFHQSPEGDTIIAMEALAPRKM